MAPKKKRSTTKKGEGGRPRVYDRVAILERFRLEMAKGTRNMEAICKDEGMPTPECIYLWIQDDDELLKIFMRAQELWCWAQRDRIIDIADDDSRDVLEETLETEAGTVTRRRSDNTAVNRDNLRVRARQWAMAKLAPKLFGELIQTELSGKGGEPIVPVLNVTIAKDGTG